MRILVVSGNRAFGLPHAGKKPIDYFLADDGDVEASGRDPADLVYLDRGGMAAEAFAKSLALLKRGRAGRPWGVIDPDGSVDDPAELIRAGASDYIGPGVLDAGVEPGRWKKVLAWSEAPADEARGEDARAGAGHPKRRAEDFPGWAALKPGEVREFYFFYAAPSEPAMVKAKIGDTRYQAFRERFRAYFSQALAEAGGIAWMQNDSAVIYLIPPDHAFARAAVIAAVKALLSATHVAYERMGLTFPLAMTLALHKGRTAYQPPGRTGKIISDDVNFIHHLGIKRAEKDRLTVTADAADALPRELCDLFVPAGSFEERSLRHSRRFAPGRA